MKVKHVLSIFFQEEQELRLSNKHKKVLIDSILAQEKKESPSIKNRLFLRYFAIPTFAVAVLLMIFWLKGNGMSSNQHNTTPLVVKKVSAEELLRSVEALVKEDKLHYATSFESLTDESAGRSEEWIDRKKQRIKRIVYDKSGSLSSLSIGNLPPTSDGHVNEFTWDRKTKEGIFVKIQNAGVAQDIGIERDFMLALEGKYIGNPTTLETITYNGKPVYKLTLKERDEREIVMTILFDTTTHLPIEEVGYQDIDTPAWKKTYQFYSDNFQPNVFELVPPQGYTTMSNGKITGFTIYSSGAYNTGGKEFNGDMRSIQSVGFTYKNSRSTVSIMNDGIPVGLSLRVYESNETFLSRAAAENATQLQFIEVPRYTSPYEKLENSFLLTEYPDTLFGKFRLDIYNAHGKKLYEVFEVIPYKDIAFDKFR